MPPILEHGHRSEPDNSIRTKPESPQQEVLRVAFKALELGASSVYCSASPFIIEAMAREGIPVVGHLGLVSRHVTWTGYRAIGKTAEEAKLLYQKMKELIDSIDGTA